MKNAGKFLVAAVLCWFTFVAPSDLEGLGGHGDRYGGEGYGGLPGGYRGPQGSAGGHGGGGSFAGSAAFAGTGGHGGHSQSQSASFAFGPFSASFSHSQAHAGGRGFYDY